MSTRQKRAYDEIAGNLDVLDLVADRMGMLGNINMNGNKITSVGNPSSSGDVATKAYVDTTYSSFHFLTPVRVASTINIVNPLTTLVNGYDNIDTVLLATGDRVLLKNQTDAAENGIYVVNDPAPATKIELVESNVVFANEGALNKDSGFLCTSVSPMTIQRFATVAPILSAFDTKIEITGEPVAGELLVAVDNVEKLTINATTTKITQGNSYLQLDDAESELTPSTMEMRLDSAQKMTISGTTTNIIQGDTSIAVYDPSSATPSTVTVNVDNAAKIECSSTTSVIESFDTKFIAYDEGSAAYTSKLSGDVDGTERLAITKTAANTLSTKLGMGNNSLQLLDANAGSNQLIYRGGGVNGFVDPVTGTGAADCRLSMSYDTTVIGQNNSYFKVADGGVGTASIRVDGLDKFTSTATLTRIKQGAAATTYIDLFDDASNPTMITTLANANKVEVSKNTTKLRQNTAVTPTDIEVFDDNVGTPYVKIRISTAEVLTVEAASVNVHSHKIVNVSDPVANQDAVTLAYFNANLSGTSDERVKDGIEYETREIQDSAIEKFKKLKLCEFSYKWEDKDRRQLGFVAQDLDQLNIRNSVVTDTYKSHICKTGLCSKESCPEHVHSIYIKRVRNDSLVPLLVSVINSLLSDVEKLKSKL